MSQPVVPNPNTITPLPEAISTINYYMMGKNRKDMGVQEYLRFRNDWVFFNTVYAYNYTVSTMNGLSADNKFYNPWQFASNGDLTSYMNGQTAHTSFYSNAPIGQFGNFF